MRLLLDTHVLLWWLADDSALPTRARDLISDPANEVFMSAMSIWEIVVKVRLGKLDADVTQVLNAVLQGGIQPLPFTLQHAAVVATLPDHHRDPFDRALIAQARREPMHLLTHDTIVGAYGDTVLLV